jgi:hypothetical protein
MTAHDDEVGTIRERMLERGYRLTTQTLSDGAFMSEAIPVGGARGGPGRMFSGATELEAAQRAWESLPAD